MSPTSKHLIALLLLSMLALLSVGCEERRDPDWEGITAATMAEAQVNRAQAEITKAEAEKRQAEAQVVAAQAAQAQAGVNAEYASTMHDAIGGLVGITNQAQSLLTVQTMLPYAIIGGLVVALIVLGIVGIYLLRYQMAAAQAQRAMWEACVQRLELERGQPPVLFIRSGVRANREHTPEG
ncbi:MAG: hypothetical protein KKA73_27975 [Chloroflexi bacterium]|nr:hypothetical protein [Chloroflexota bacterium]MBU1751536.1 hypothetical protein [Chloroflexota bacterium]